MVTNTGKFDRTDVEVTDDKLGFICTIGYLAVGASETCTAGGFAEVGHCANIGTVTGEFGEEPVSDTDPSHYFGGSGVVIRRNRLGRGRRLPPRRLGDVRNVLV